MTRAAAAGGTLPRSGQAGGASGGSPSQGTQATPVNTSTDVYYGTDGTASRISAYNAKHDTGGNGYVEVRRTKHGWSAFVE